MRGLSDASEDGEDVRGVNDLLIRRAARHLLPQGEKDAPGSAVAAVLDRRCLTDSPRPIAVALSGGGDSVALLLAAQDWAAAHGRRLVALTVDHRLQTQSLAWTDACAALADRLGAGFQA